MLDNVYFGIFISIFFYLLALKIQKMINHPLVNPLFIATVGIISFMLIFNIPIDAYLKGGAFLEMLLIVGTVCLAVPLYKNLDLLRKNALPILGGVFVGSLTSILSVLFLGKLFGLNLELIESIMAKSITSGMAIPLIEELGGIPSITAFSIIVTGVSGAVMGPSILKLFKVDDPVAFGVSMGVTSHVSGTAKAMEVGEKEGTIAGICIVLAGLVTITVFPLVLKLI